MRIVIPTRVFHVALMFLMLTGALFFGRNQLHAAAPTTLTLGSANGFNQYILEDVTLSGSRAGGRVAYGGNISVTNHNIGDDNPTLCDPMLNVALFGSDVNYIGGQINAGSAVYAGTVISDAFTLTCPGSTFSMSSPIDFGMVATEFTSLSNDYAAQPANGRIESSNCFIKLIGTTTGENVFEFDGEALLANNSTNTCSIFIDVPCGATAIINVSGETINLSKLDVVIIGGITRGQVLFNLHEATTVNMDNGSNFEGAVFAPKADFTVAGASFIEGTLVAKSLTGDSFNTNDFPLIPPTATCIDYGDLPAAYTLTKSSDNGARHQITDLYLGMTVDGEPDGQEDASARKDDFSAINDEDGIMATPTNWAEGADGAAVAVAASQDGCLTAWIDWDNDREFGQTNDKIIDNVPVVGGGGGNALTFAVPGNVIGTQEFIFGRFRLTPRDENGACTATVEPTGLIVGGEVEDYRLILMTFNAVTLNKSSTVGGSTLIATLTILVLVAGITIRSAYNRP